MIWKNCELCGKEFESYVSQKRRFCSISCSATSTGRRLVAEGKWNRPTKPKTGIWGECVVCSTPIWLKKSDQARGKKYCSTKCHDIGQTHKKIVRNCAYCGKEMKLRPNDPQRHCSRDCHHEGRVRRTLDWHYNDRPARLDRKGYVMVWHPDYEGITYKGWVLYHRVLMSEVLGRPLRSDEAVHHINGIKDDNRLDNLEVMDAFDHARLSARDYRESINAQLAELERYRERYGLLEDA